MIDNINAILDDIYLSLNDANRPYNSNGFIMRDILLFNFAYLRHLGWASFIIVANI